ncbi:MAG: phosphocholine cytidylyltransferase family protein [Lachnospiraceae bacterium]|jgi:choline kinase|nr:phosphocholine cytidylyltransferase family protein [uncultured Acetatifactor sp.]MCI9220012.1 phosphocholine cytidylyltransferase family protein [Lachnospiraceae bacterium]
MKYIFLVAGKGSRLSPLTSDMPKSMFKLGAGMTLIARMVNLIRQYDRDADIVVVTGHRHKSIERELDGVTFINNPFYEVTNSIASLWFAKEHLDTENVVLIDGDIVMSENLVRDVLCKPVERPQVLLDSSISENGDYNVQTSGERVLVMSKELNTYYGEYAGVTKLDRKSALAMREEIESMVDSGYYDQWYENALVQMIFRDDFELFYTDISAYDWTEVDNVSDLIHAKNIHMSEK